MLCRAVILCLLLIESALYFLIADNYFRFTSPPLEMIQDGQLLTVFLEGAWFTLIGPAIVLSLYLLGHLSAESYFKYTRFAVLDDFRKSLETAHQLSQKYIKDISVGDRRVEEIKVKLNRLDIDREERTDELPGLLAKYTKELQEKIKLCEEAAHRLQSSQIKPPSQNAMLVASEQSTQLLKSGVL